MSSNWSKDWKKNHYPDPPKPSESQQEPNLSVPSSFGNVSSEVAAPSPTLELSGSSLLPIKEGALGEDAGLASVSSAEPTGQLKKAEEVGEETPRPKMTPENLERDYWDIVETQTHDIDVDYGNDVDTSEFGSGFPISQRGRSVNSPNFQGETPEDLPEPAFGTDEFYKETYWNLNNIPNSPNSVLRHLKVGINGINVPWL